MDNALGITILAASTVISVLLVIFGTFLMNQSSNKLNNSVYIVQRLVSVDNSDFNRVNQDTIRGSEVVQLLKKFDNSGYRHLVITEAVPQGYYGVDSITDPESEEYIKSDKVFSGSVVRDRSNTVIAVKFKEQDVADREFDLEASKAVGVSYNRKIQNRQYDIFCQIKRYGAVSSELAGLYVQYLQALKTKNAKELLYIYKKFAKDVEFSENPNEKQENALRVQSQFLENIITSIKSWQNASWWDAIEDGTIRNASSITTDETDDNSTDFDDDWGPIDSSILDENLDNSSSSDFAGPMDSDETDNDDYSAYDPSSGYNPYTGNDPSVDSGNGTEGDGDTTPIIDPGY